MTSRERAKALCHTCLDGVGIHRCDEIAAAIDAAVEEEREACARACEEYVREHKAERAESPYPHTFCEDFGCSSFDELAAEIRALEPPKNS